MGDFFSVAGRPSEHWRLLLFIISSPSSQDCSPRLTVIQSLQWICKGDAIKKAPRSDTNTGLNELEKKEKSIFVTEKEEASKSLLCAQYHSCPSEADPQTSPTPTLTQRDTKSILPVFTRCCAGVWWHRGLANMEQADALHLRILYQKRKEEKQVHSQPISSREYRPQRKPFPVCISWVQILSEFLFGMRRWSGLAFPVGLGRASPTTLER